MPRSPMLMGAAAGYLLLSLAWVKLPPVGGVDIPFGLPMILNRFRQDLSVDPPRLLHVVAAGYLIAMLPQDFPNSPAAQPGNALAVMGRHALPVFVAGTILSMAAQAWAMFTASGFATDIIIIAGGIWLQFALAHYIDWISTASPNRRRQRCDEFRRNRSTAWPPLGAVAVPLRKISESPCTPPPA